MGTESKKPLVNAYKIKTCFSTGNGLCRGCLSTSTVRRPRLSLAWVAASKSGPNWVKITVPEIGSAGVKDIVIQADSDIELDNV